MKYIGPKKFVGLANYMDVFHRTEIFRALLVSVYYMGGAVSSWAGPVFCNPDGI